jgi:hypothetical protein
LGGGLVSRPTGGIVRTRRASSSRSPKTTTTARRSTADARHRSKTKASTATASTGASGGREVTALHPQAPVSTPQAAPPTSDDRGIGFDTPGGHLSISPTGFQLGGSGRSLASVDGVLTAVLDTLAVLAALAAAIGGVAAVNMIRRKRQAARRRARMALARRRTREQLYSEAKRQNIPGRSSMTKAELERALYPEQRVRQL